MTRVIVELTGGMANQLFQWAAGYLLATEYSAELVIDGRIPERPWERGVQIDQILQDVYVGRPSACDRFVWRGINHLGRLPRAAAKRISLALPRTGVLVDSYESGRAVLESGRDVRLRGFFQDADRLYANREPITKRVNEGLIRLVTGDARILPARFAAMHVRRGDYALVKEYASEFGVCSVDYYRRSMDALSPELPIIVVSDDAEWSRSTFARVDNRIQIYDGRNHFDDLYALSSASELVLANSTFSWWAAFLGKAHQVIAPNPWFTNRSREKGLVIKSWTVLPRD